eukprot:m51a1_g9127 hypothetical protein (92) ;mRNA; f:3347-5478
MKTTIGDTLCGLRTANSVYKILMLREMDCTAIGTEVNASVMVMPCNMAMETLPLFEHRYQRGQLAQFVSSIEEDTRMHWSLGGMQPGIVEM